MGNNNRTKSRKQRLTHSRGGGLHETGSSSFQLRVFLFIGFAILVSLRIQSIRDSFFDSGHNLLQHTATPSGITNQTSSTTPSTTTTSQQTTFTLSQQLQQQSSPAAAVGTTTTTTTTTSTPTKPSSRNGGKTTVASSHPKFSSLNVMDRIEHFRDTARQLTPTSDKIGVHSEHRYHNMYGMYLLPYATVKPNFKMIEIGLGCNMDYGAGASVALWKELFPQADLWEAEYDGECVEKALAKGQLEGINPLVGDQADFAVLDSWISKSGGQFDIVIDDGGHHNCQMSNSFDKLWPQVLPGGIYFIEDMHVGKAVKYKSPSCGNILMSDRIMEWTEQLMYQTNTFSWVWKHKLPADVMFVSCQAEACVIGKKKSDDINGPYQGKQRTN